MRLMMGWDQPAVNLIKVIVTIGGIFSTVVLLFGVLIGTVVLLFGVLIGTVGMRSSV